MQLKCVSGADEVSLFSGASVNALFLCSIWILLFMRNLVKVFLWPGPALLGWQCLG